ncbi:carboxypeptidase-like regulatory domain-containing protein [Williamwhitmania taraxaci]|uniref:CarboxypepD_reg-like domain-containing protein n=1 Tax=Williamwhitmania taraxaci TaxID=1640674 RepID=A0A1G6JQV2_9BACT|nr:carboxypeptidase-like regulatory domain-containing protein [Williamwhitmania taraxaci]SDC21109.1 CarboxypepD_reg-like domain-containing protein [Williamwhitmania taraxaci]
MKALMNKLAGIGMIIMLLVSAGSAFGQEAAPFVTITGVVKDSKTKDRLPFASINIVGSSVGTVANSEGEFSLKVLTSLNALSFEVSHLGYVNKLFSVSESQEKEVVCYVDAYSIVLDAVIITPENARSLVEEAVNKIKDNYNDVPNSMVAFYREYVKQRKDFLSISEALVDIYKAPYGSSFDNDRVKINKARKGNNIKKADTLAIKLQGGPSVMLLLDVVKNPDVLLSQESLDSYHFEVTDMVNIDNDLNYVVSFTPRVILPYPLYIGKLYISKERKAISMITFTMDMSDMNKASQQFIRKKPYGLIFTPTSATYMVTYKQFDGKYYLNYTRSEIKFRCDWKKRWFKNNYTVVSEQAVTDRSSVNVVKFQSKDAFKSTEIFADRVHAYFNGDFWGDQNVIEPEESIQDAIKKFNKQYVKQQDRSKQ